MKIVTRIQIIALMVCFFISTATAALTGEEKGEALFLSLKCNKCHAPQEKVNGPSLHTIANAYGEVDNLILFFNGTSQPIVEPERAKTMKPRRRQLKKLSEADQMAMASFVMSYK